MKIKILSLCIIVLIFLGCSAIRKLYPPTLKYRKAYVETTPQLAPAIKKAILNGDIIVGMTWEEVIASRGRPYRINRTTTTYGITEQWIMPPGDSNVVLWSKKSRQYFYIYFKNGKVTAWQNW